MKALKFVKTYTGLVPADAEAREKLNSLEHESVVMIELKRPRSSAFHRKYFALLNLAFDYWEPTGGLTRPDEEKLIRKFCGWLEKHTGSWQSKDEIVTTFLDDLAQVRAEKLPVVHKSFDVFRDWVMVEAGFYNIVQSPAGLKKVPKSVSYAAMDASEFAEAYRAVFGVVWRFVLSQHFEDEDAVEAALNQLESFA